MPWSEEATTDDKRLDSVAYLICRDIVVTEKLDGEKHEHVFRPYSCSQLG